MTTFRALTTNVSVEIEPDVVQRDLALALVSSYPQAEASELQYKLRRTEVERAGEIVTSAAEDLVPLFEMDLYEQLVTRASSGLLLHAAAIDIGGRALVLCGPSGAGKTTLTLALVARGLRLLTEEVVLIDKDGLVLGLARPIHVAADSPQRARIPADWATVPYRIRTRDGGMQESTLVIPPPHAFHHGPLPLHAIVRIGHGSDWAVHLQRSPDSVALQRLWDRALRQDDAGLVAATQLLREHGSYELSSQRESEALHLLEPLLK